MSLVGSLEDLGLADILQIVSLARKSGVLVLRGEDGEGRIVFQAGLVHAAVVKGEHEDLPSLRDPVGGDPVPEPERREGTEALRCELVERAVARMFEWRSAEFSFDVRDDLDPADAERALAVGMSPQYLTIEATRRGDERRAGMRPRGDEALVFSGDDVPAADAHAALVDAILERADPRGPGSLVGADEEPGVPPAAAGRVRTACARIVVVDPDLAALEWVKAILSDLFERVHIFQGAEGGIARIRQYLSRGDPPAVLLSERAPMDPLSGIDTAAELLRRLRAQSPRMPLLILSATDDPAPRAARLADGVVARPGVGTLLDPRSSDRVAAAAHALRAQVAPFARLGGSDTDAAPARGIERSRPEPADGTAHADVLWHLLDLAAGTFSRAALFLVRDSRVEGIAQRGLPSGGGPDDATIGELRLGADEAAWFRRAIESGQARSAPPTDEGDRVLAARLGRVPAPEAFVAPVVAGGGVVALLYADNLPGGGASPDTATLAAAAREAGLALDRAARERAGGA